MTTGGKPVVGSNGGDVSPLPPTTLLERLEYMDRTLQISLGKPGLSLYGEAAAEIRRLMELLKK